MLAALTASFALVAAPTKGQTESGPPPEAQPESETGRAAPETQPESPEAGAPGVEFTDELEQESSEGHLILAWMTDVEGGQHAIEYQLEYSPSADFAEAELWYQGPQERSFVSGLGSGEHFYRVRTRMNAEAPWGPWSEPMHITVKLQDMTIAWILFGVGAVMFVCIAAFIIWQALRPGPSSSAEVSS
jgi:hypothetical protein